LEEEVCANDGNPVVGRTLQVTPSLVDTYSVEPENARILVLTKGLASRTVEESPVVGKAAKERDPLTVGATVGTLDGFSVGSADGSGLGAVGLAVGSGVGTSLFIVGSGVGLVLG
jgi:hypothetical protein